MADETPTPAPAPAPEAPKAAAAPAPEVPVTTVAPAQPAAPEDAKGVTVTQGTVPAQVTGPPQAPRSLQPVLETRHDADVVITDTSHPLAVQLGPAAPAPAVNPLTPEESLAQQLARGQ
jgi:hypothetical protein